MENCYKTQEKVSVLFHLGRHHGHAVWLITFHKPVGSRSSFRIGGIISRWVAYCQHSTVPEKDFKTSLGDLVQRYLFRLCPFIGKRSGLHAKVKRRVPCVRGQ